MGTIVEAIGTLCNVLAAFIGSECQLGKLNRKCFKAIMEYT